MIEIIHVVRNEIHLSLAQVIVLPLSLVRAYGLVSCACYVCWWLNDGVRQP